MKDGAAVQAEGLVKTYNGRGDAVKAVRGVDLTVEAGEVFGFLGPNGAGKSTTVKMLTTLLSITSGTARVAGVNVASDPDEVRRRIGVALQEAGLDPRQTGRELLILQARLFGLAPAAAADRAEELLALVELEDAADRRIKGYSGGMKRRLDLASALVHEPDVLFLDEPTTGLDPASRQAIWSEIRNLNAGGTTVFLTTQYLEEADHLADEIAILHGGRIVANGTPDELKALVPTGLVELEFGEEAQLSAAQSALGDRHEVDRVDSKLVVTTTGSVAEMADMFIRLKDSGVEPTGFSRQLPTLDDVFFKFLDDEKEDRHASAH